ncbi:MAG: cache domain-containing protein [Caldilineaceae bacterium]|nr:cache domain-containing protein [Caldilineaceae bacterium]
MYPSPIDDLSEVDKETLSAELVGALRYGEEGYYYGYEVGTGVNRIHGSKPELIGSNLWDSQDANETYFIRQLDENARSGEFRILEYLYPKLGSDQPVPKMGTAKLVPEANLWVGTGRYIDSIAMDEAAISAEIQQMTDRSLRILLTVVVLGFLVALSVGWFFTRRLTRPIQQVVGVAYAISDGNLDEDITVDRKDEVGQLAAAFRSMLGYLRATADVANAIAEGDLTEVSTVAEENSAAAENVSTNAQDVSAQVEETIASAESLTEMARLLQHVVDQFRLDADGSRPSESSETPIRDSTTQRPPEAALSPRRG